MSNILQEEIADEMSRRTRVKAALFMVRDLSTEDIEMVNKHFPYLADSARHEILNPEVTPQGCSKGELAICCANEIQELGFTFGAQFADVAKIIKEYL